MGKVHTQRWEGKIVWHVGPTLTGTVSRRRGRKRKVLPLFFGWGSLTLSGVFLNSLFIITKVLAESEISPFISDLTPLFS
jgi:hypothetical protein